MQNPFSCYINCEVFDYFPLNRAQLSTMRNIPYFVSVTKEERCVELREGFDFGYLDSVKSFDALVFLWSLKMEIIENQEV